ncbi:MAG: 4a-hydroxytetrahydrobiopterin dehydratase [Patiriisocius sp.]|jgi:4a-hydroxytetrahydrobiopterin dehydratase
MWKEENDMLTRTFEFDSFVDAWGFMSKVAILAEKHNHHPNWSNLYNKVRINLNTHDADNTVTHKDWELATAIDNVLG